jgi:hypothetical protein
MYGAVLDSEASRVEVGPTSIICENAVLRATAIGDEECPVLLGDHILRAQASSLEISHPPKIVGNVRVSRRGLEPGT